jgi:uncharacterized protein (DUF1015 family)
VTFITNDQVKVHRVQDLVRLKEHLIADDEHRVDAGTKKTLEKQVGRGSE